MTNSHSHGNQANSSLRCLVSAHTLIALICLSASQFAEAQTQLPEDPMEDKYSQAIRAEYSKCRELTNALSRFLCSCRLLAVQCDAPRKLEHGDWNTIEFWPSKDAKDREVQFILLMNYDILGDFNPLNEGVVLTCREDFTGLDIFLGSDLNPDIKPVVTIGKKTYESDLRKDEDAYILNFKYEEKLFAALKRDLEITVKYSDSSKAKHSIMFDTFGFSQVTNGWEKLCALPSNILKNSSQEETK